MSAGQIDSDFTHVVADEEISNSDNVQAGQATEPAWLRLQSEIWESAGQALLHRLGSGTALKALDIGCGDLGWLRILSRWVGPTGAVMGTDVDDRLLDAARDLVRQEGLDNVTLVHDDLFNSRLEPKTFDLLHARFAVTPLDKTAEQLQGYRRLLRSGGWLVLEDNDLSSWHFNPPAPAAERLIHLIEESFLAAGETLNVGRRQPELLRAAGLEPEVRAEIRALAPGDPYLRLPLHFSLTLEPRLLKLVSEAELEDLRRHAEAEIATPGRWGTTFTLVQTWAKVP